MGISQMSWLMGSGRLGLSATSKTVWVPAFGHMTVLGGLKATLKIASFPRKRESRLIERTLIHHWFKGAGIGTSLLSLPAGEVKTGLSLTKACGHWLLVRFMPRLCFFLFCIGCRNAELRPIEIMAEDMCSFCRMAISEKRFASELLTQDGEVFKFDDIGCMLRFRKSHGHPDSVVATFVLDYGTRKWIKAEEAYFVRSKEFKTPMGGNVVAFKTGADAAAAADRTQGVSLRYAALLEDQ
jgi:copper chaperone NosL